MGVAATPSSHRSRSRGRHAVGFGQDHVGVGRGEAGVVAGIVQRGGDDVGVERSGPGETDLAARAAGPVDEDPDPDAGGVRRRERLDLAVVGPHLGVGAPRHVDLHALAGTRPADDRLREVVQIVHAVPPRVTPVMRSVA